MHFGYKDTTLLSLTTEVKDIELFLSSLHRITVNHRRCPLVRCFGGRSNSEVLGILRKIRIKVASFVFLVIVIPIKPGINESM